MLQDLCPRCGADWLDGARACPACGFDPIGLRAASVADTGREVHLRPMDVALLTLAMVALIAVALGAGWRLLSETAVTLRSLSRGPSRCHRGCCRLLAAIAPIG